MLKSFVALIELAPERDVLLIAIAVVGAAIKAYATAAEVDNTF